MPFQPNRPYNDLAAPPPEDLETKAVLKACIEERAARDQPFGRPASSVLV
jgi:hypothetical protein